MPSRWCYWRLAKLHFGKCSFCPVWDTIHKEIFIGEIKGFKCQWVLEESGAITRSRSDGARRDSGHSLEMGPGLWGVVILGGLAVVVNLGYLMYGRKPRSMHIKTCLKWILQVDDLCFLWESTLCGYLLSLLCTSFPMYPLSFRKDLTKNLQLYIFYIWVWTCQHFRWSDMSRAVQSAGDSEDQEQ